MKIGPISGLVLLGGGENLLQIARWAQEATLKVKVVTSKRHSQEIISENQSLGTLLEEEQISFIKVADIDSPEVSRFLSGSEENWAYISLGAAWIFKSYTIKRLFKDRLLNVHGTRLPTNRGGGGFSWQIMMGNRFGFCLIHKVDAGVDTGPIIAYEEFIYPSNCRIPEDFEKVYNSKTIEFVKSFIQKVNFESVIFNETKQVEYLSTYWPRLKTELNGWINWHWTASEIERFICAFDEPYVGAHTFLNKRKVYLKNVCLSPQDAIFHPYQAGLVYRVTKEWICISLAGSSLVVQKVLDEEGNSVLESIKPGDRFVTPIKFLEDSLARVFYTPN
jgi:methionyl-tRNA formyltransferase